MTFGPERQAKLKAYCEHRMEQVGQYVPVLEYFGATDAIRHYFRGLRLIANEMDSKTNDDRTKEENVYWLLRSNNCGLFFDDIHAIVNGLEPSLPDDILAIREYQDEVKRKEEEEKARIKKEADDKAWAEMQKRIAKAEAERKKARQLQLAEELGIPIENLARLQGK